VIDRRRIVHGAWAVLAAATLFGCSSGDGPSGPTPPPPPPAPGFRTTLNLAPEGPTAGAEFEAALGYELPAGSAPLGAYVVELRFDPARVSFVAADPSITNGRVVNQLGAPTGTIIVAGATSGGFADGLLLKGSFRARAADVAASDLRLTLREAVDTQLRELRP
jgi:hypothetical protein